MPSSAASDARANAPAPRRAWAPSADSYDPPALTPAQAKLLSLLDAALCHGQADLVVRVRGGRIHDHALTYRRQWPAGDPPPPVSRPV